jgi:hypothetical protein
VLTIINPHGSHLITLAFSSAITAAASAAGIAVKLDGSSADISSAVVNTGNLDLTLLDAITGITDIEIILNKTNGLTFTDDAVLPLNASYRWLPNTG